MAPSRKSKGFLATVSSWLGRVTDRSVPQTKLYQDLFIHVSLFAAVVFSMCVPLRFCVTLRFRVR
jgi:hypothetical protein